MTKRYDGFCKLTLAAIYLNNLCNTDFFSLSSLVLRMTCN